MGDHAVDFLGRSREDDLVRAIVDGDRDRTAHLPAGRLGPLAIGPGGDQAGGRDRARRFELMEDRGEPDQLPLERDVRSADTPAAARAGSSPLLWPATASGRRPSLVSTWKMAHWDESTAVTAVSVAQSASGRGSCGAAEEVMARGHLLAGFAGDPVGRVEHGTKLGEVRAEIGQHAGILGAFAREEKRERPLPAQGLLPVVEPAGIPDLPARGLSEPGLDCSQVPRPARHAKRPRCPAEPALPQPGIPY